MLVIGRVGGAWSRPMRPTGLTDDEQRTHLGLWVLLGAPLLLGCDCQPLDPGEAALMANPEVLAVHQDPLGRQARRVRVEGSLETWHKDLADGSSAVGIFNRGDAPIAAGLSWSEIGLRMPVAVRDMWTRRDLDAPMGWGATLPAHGSTLLRVRQAAGRE